MSKAKTGMKLLKWLANQADDVVASADDLKTYGPQAAKVRSLLDFLPKMSDDAAQVTGAAYRAAINSGRNAGGGAAYRAAFSDAQNAAYNAAGNAASGNARWKGYLSARKHAYLAPGKRYPQYDAYSAAYTAAGNAGGAEAVGDLIDPNTYRILTNPLATGREADIVNMNAPENVMDILRDLTERNLIVNPQDVRSARKLADLSDYERDPVMEYINALIENDYDGYRYPGSAYKSLKELIKSARLLG